LLDFSHQICNAMKAKICIPANCPAVVSQHLWLALNLVPLGRAEMLATPGASTQIQISRNHFRFELNPLIQNTTQVATLATLQVHYKEAAESEKNRSLQ